MTNYQDLADRANDEGGFTFNPKRDSFPTEGFAVSVFKGLERRVSKPALSHRDVADYFLSVAHELQQPGACLGCWADNGVWYLDVSVVVNSREEAIRLARKHDQLAIYDLAAFQTITIEQEVA